MVRNFDIMLFFLNILICVCTKASSFDFSSSFAL